MEADLHSVQVGKHGNAADYIEVIYSVNVCRVPSVYATEARHLDYKIPVKELLGRVGVGVGGTDTHYKPRCMPSGENIP